MIYVTLHFKEIVLDVIGKHKYLYLCMCLTLNLTYIFFLYRITHIGRL